MTPRIGMHFRARAGRRTIASMHEHAPAIRERLARHRPAVAYLFGSVARGEERAASDVDIAFLPLEACDSWELLEAKADLARVLRRDVDLVDLSRASTVVRAEVLRTGERLFTGDATRADEFEMYTLADYAELNEQRGPAVQSFLEAIRNAPAKRDGPA